MHNPGVRNDGVTATLSGMYQDVLVAQHEALCPKGVCLFVTRFCAGILPLFLSTGFDGRLCLLYLSQKLRVYWSSVSRLILTAAAARQVSATAEDILWRGRHPLGPTTRPTPSSLPLARLKNIFKPTLGLHSEFYVQSSTLSCSSRLGRCAALYFDSKPGTRHPLACDPFSLRDYLILLKRCCHRWHLGPFRRLQWNKQQHQPLVRAKVSKGRYPGRAEDNGRRNHPRPAASFCVK